ncbi:hypothetical protein CFPG_P1-16 (plasmid) [Candidatus Azobacteroides pseudotrichonymphae genomovar. CFP2]|uniref:Uncharacterized protein n=1 Tax=Azobacteroides pseudotrichonymphae genomovar. CFP2 TaxID=511995 RepID=B6YS65_AZOPC|nr:hypothetical protein CFPG_P1-16 [Candidatus Azobacteroides pseudotrichonymphae genomovar. CFP2]
MFSDGIGSMHVEFARKHLFLANFKMGRLNYLLALQLQRLAEKNATERKFGGLNDV